MLNVRATYGLTKALSPKWEMTEEKNLLALTNKYLDVYISYEENNNIVYSSIVRLIEQYSDSSLSLDGLVVRITEPLGKVYRLPAINHAQYRSIRATTHSYRAGQYNRYYPDNANVYDYNDILLQNASYLPNIDFANYCLFNVGGYLHYGRHNGTDSWVINGFKTLKLFPNVDDFGIWSFRDISPLTITPLTVSMWSEEEAGNVVITLPESISDKYICVVIGGRLLTLDTLGVQRASDSLLYVNVTQTRLPSVLSEMKRSGMIGMDADMSSLINHPLSYIVSFTKPIEFNLQCVNYRLHGLLRLSSDVDSLLIDKFGRAVNYWCSTEDGVKLVTFDEPTVESLVLDTVSTELYGHYRPTLEKYLLQAFSY